VKVELVQTRSGKVLAAGDVKDGKATWSGSRFALDILDNLLVPPDDPGHIEFADAYFARSTSMHLRRR